MAIKVQTMSDAVAHLEAVAKFLKSQGSDDADEADEEEPDKEEDDAEDEKPAKRGRGRPPGSRNKPKVEEDDEEPEEEEEDDEEPEEDDEDDEEEADEDEEDEKPAKGKKAPAKKETAETVLVPAFQAYAKKHSRAAAMGVLKKFKAKNVTEIPKEKWPAVLKALKL